MTTDTFLKYVVAMQINAIFFGVGAVVVLAVPALNTHAKYLLPAVVVTSFVLAPLFAGFISRRMRIRNWGQGNWKKGDDLSG